MSLFTFDTNPQRVISPWLKGDPGKPISCSKLSVSKGRLRRGDIESGLLSDYGLTKLEAEPQEGPIEYKLHLLLRPRRKYERTSTVTHISGSIQSRPPQEPPKGSKAALVVGNATTQTLRQQRLEQLTSQLLWRLEQSCPYHASSARRELVVPKLPSEDFDSNAPIPIKQGKLLPGLEGSKGALYEIGVADDGTLVGLTEDELDECLHTLRIMASSLGCSMEVHRIVEVGDCEYAESDDLNVSKDTETASATQNQASSPSGETSEDQDRRHAILWAAEALVKPDLSRKEDMGMSSTSPPRQEPLTTNQLRVTLTGPTTSGKSTILGTLSTGALDNGRGRSRVCLLKHPHELVSGVTSTVKQELIGYDEGAIFNYDHSSIRTWEHIHDFTKTGRLVYLSDSAGLTRYRRSILRGIIGWAPHWTMLCIASNLVDHTSTARAESSAGGTSSAEDSPGSSVADGVDLAFSHLDLCLRLRLPLVIVITKFDLTNKDSKSFCQKILDKVKEAGREPRIAIGVKEDKFNRISDYGRQKAKLLTAGLAGDLLSAVPVVFTGAVDGRGIGLLHALLESLPLPPAPTARDYIGAALNPEQPACLFHIEDKYNLPASSELATQHVEQQTDTGTVVAGHLRFGSLSIGDKVVVGPFPPEDDESRSSTPPEDGLASGVDGLSLSSPSSTELNRISAKNTVSASTIKGEWHTALIVSIRNLQLPVQTLTAGQVATIGMVFDPPENEGSENGLKQPSSIPTLRKGMVLAVPSDHMIATGLSLQAASGLTAVFEDDGAGKLAVGSGVHIYVASVRAMARVVSVSKMDDRDDGSKLATEDIRGDLSLDGDTAVDEEDPPVVQGGVAVQLELLSRREWIELGSQILIMQDTGLDGCVGKVVEIVE